MTEDMTIDKLSEGDVVVAVNGVPRPFPYTVTQVINIQHGRRTHTTVKYAHGGLITPCDPKTATATVLRTAE